MDQLKDSHFPSEKMLPQGTSSYVLPSPSQSSENLPAALPSLVDRLVLPAASSQPSPKKIVMAFDPRRHKDVPKELQMKDVPAVIRSDQVHMLKPVMTFIDKERMLTDEERRNLIPTGDVKTRPLYQPAPLLGATAACGTMYPVEVSPQPYESYARPDALHLIGEGFFEGYDGYYYGRQSNKAIRFTTFHLKIEAEIHQLHLHDNSVSTLYRIRVFGIGVRQATLEIPMEKWDSLETKIKELYPAWTLCKEATYKASDLFRRLTGLLLEKSSFSPIITSFDWGWGLQASNQGRRFYHGNRSDCCCEKALLEQLAPAKRMLWLTKAFTVLGVGDFSVTVPMLTYGACAYLDALFCDAGYPLDFALMVMGNTGFMKTSLCRVLFNVFEKRQSQIHSIRGTAAAMSVLHQEAFDDILVVDDFNLEGSQQDVKEKAKNFQALIRAYSDKTPREKYAGNHQVTSYAIRGGLVITGETEVTGQIKSSELRYLRVVLSQRLDGQHLQVFQDDPEIMKHFWSEYIYFLERKYPDLVRRFKAQFPSKRGMMADVQEPRLRDDYAHLALAWETLIDFLIDANVINQEDQSKWTAYADQYFAMLVRRQCVEAQKEDPYIRYIKEFWNLIGTGKVTIADNLEIYVENIGRYIGYVEQAKNVYWIKADDMFTQVLNACRERGENLPMTQKEILRQLKEHDLTLYNSGSALMKASSKILGRPRMVVLKIADCESIINQN